MKPDIIISGVSMNQLGWLREMINFPTPQSQTETIVVPGRNAPIRYTEALGRVSYQPRSFEITLSVCGSREKFNRMRDELNNQFAGKLKKVIVSEEPGFYVLGTLELSPSYDPLLHKGIVVISCADGDAYRYHTEETVLVQSGTGTLLLENDYMPVMPRVETDAETVFSWKVGTDVFRKTVSPGTWEFPEMELGVGRNSISIETTGTVTFRYREGRL